MWRASAGIPLQVSSSPDDDWETDPDFINDVSEEEQRWGSRTIPGSGRIGDSIDMHLLREEVATADAIKKKKELEEGPKAAFGYGGKFGVQSDRMDRSAVGHDYVANVQKHASQVDYRTGFGGKFGIQSDRIDKCAATYDSVEKLQKHASQKDYTAGFGGKYGIQRDRQDKCAVGWDYKETIEKHNSQKDYAIGFGGKFGVQEDRKDKSALGYNHVDAPNHQNQVDYKKINFDQKFSSENDGDGKIGDNYEEKQPFCGGSVKSSSLRAKFENLVKLSEEESRKRTDTGQQRHQYFLEKKKAEDQEEEHRFFLKTQEKENLEYCKEETKNPATFSSIAETSAETSNIKFMNEFFGGMNISKNQPESYNCKTSNSMNVYSTEEKLKILNIEREEIPMTGYEPTKTSHKAIALYDYQASADDEISFDPDDIITHVEMVCIRVKEGKVASILANIEGFRDLIKVLRF